MALSNSDALSLVTGRVSPDVSPPERFYWEHRVRRNLAYLSGIQHMVQDPHSGAIRQIRGQRGGMGNRDSTANILLPHVMRAVSAVTKVGADFRVAPNSNSRKDREAAKIGEKVFQHIRENVDFEAKRNKATLWAAASGIGVLKVSWNPESGEANRIYLASKAEKLAEGFPGDARVPVIKLNAEEMREKERAGLFEDVSPGDIEVDVTSAYAFYWDSAARDGGLKDAEWCAWHSIMDVELLTDMYGAKAKNVQPDEGLSHGTLYELEAAMLHGGQAGLYAPYSPQLKKGKRTTVTEYWERPTRRNKYKGRKIVLAGGQVLENIDNPYVPAGIDLPFVIFSWIPRAGSFVSIDLVGQLTDPQRGYNKSNTVMQEVEATNGYPGFIVWKNSNIKTARIGSFPGWIFQVAPNTPPPVPLQPPNLPPYIAQNAENRRREMQEISGQFDPFQGKSSGQVRGTGGIQSLIQAGKEAMDMTTEANTSSVAEVGRMILKLAGHHYTKDRLVKVLGEDSQWDVFTFMGADLRGNYDVRVLKHPGENGMNPVIMELLSAGFFQPGNPEHERIVFDSLHMKTPDRFFDDRLANQRNAERENEDLVASAELMAEMPGGEEVPEGAVNFPVVRDYEDHITHIAIHNRLRLSKEYMAEMTPSGQKLVDAHVMQHQAYVSEMLAGQAAQEQQAKEKGTASQPKPGGGQGGGGGASPTQGGAGGSAQPQQQQPQQPQQQPPEQNPYA